MRPQISVIVTTYNQQDTIGRALDSVLMQQCHVPFEIVIGEDHSTDGTLAVCKQYAEKHPDKIRLMANAENKGIVNNYIDCILAGYGQYIADCAGDDFWTDPLKLEKEITLMENHPEVTLVHTDWMMYNETTHSASPSADKPFTAAFTPGSEMLEAIITQTNVPVIHLCTSLYRRDIVVEALQEDEQMLRNPEFGCEDLQISCIMAKAGDIAYLPEVTLYYSTGHESVSFSETHHKQFRFVRRVTALSYYLAEKYHIRSPRVDAYFQQRLFALAMHALRSKDQQLYHEALYYRQLWNVQGNCMTQLAFTVMRHQWLWQAALVARKIFVSAKRIFR